MPLPAAAASLAAQPRCAEPSRTSLEDASPFEEAPPVEDLQEKKCKARRNRLGRISPTETVAGPLSGSLRRPFSAVQTPIFATKQHSPAFFELYIIALLSFFNSIQCNASVGPKTSEKTREKHMTSNVNGPRF